mgnify:CR=1 FL=1
MGSIIIRVLPESLRVELKKPLGEILRGKESEVNPILKNVIESGNFTMVIAVGDEVSSSLASLGIKAKLYIYDEKTKRKFVKQINIPAKQTFWVKNPAGTLTDESLEAVRKALDSEFPVAIKVEGEEDLLTLAAILYAPLNSLVVYGQPDEGVVLVRVTDERKKFVEDIIRRMDVVV